MTSRTLISEFEHARPRAKRSALYSVFPFASFLTAGTAAGMGVTLLLGLFNPSECDAHTTVAAAQPEYHSILPFLDGYAYTGDPDGVPAEGASTAASAQSEQSKPSASSASNETSEASGNTTSAERRAEAPVVPAVPAVPAAPEARVVSESGEAPDAPEAADAVEAAQALRSVEAPEAPAPRETARLIENGADAEGAPAREAAPRSATEELAQESATVHAKAHAKEPVAEPAPVPSRPSAVALEAPEATETEPVRHVRTAQTDHSDETAFRAAPHAENPFVRRRETVPSLAFHISPYQTSRLAVEGERIASAIWDQNDLTLEAESRTGEVYLLPKHLGRMQLYVTTESGETAGITIVADELAEPENIVLERRRSRETNERRTAPTRQLPALPASDFEGALKTFAATLARGEETPAVEKRPCVETEAVLHARKVLATLAPKSEACYAARGLFATRIRIKNRSIRPVLVRESALLAPQVLAVTAEKPVLAAGESTVLHIIEATHD